MNGLNNKYVNKTEKTNSRMDSNPFDINNLSASDIVQQKQKDMNKSLNQKQSKQRAVTMLSSNQAPDSSRAFHEQDRKEENSQV